MEIFDPYSHSLAAMAGFAILILVLGALSTVGRTPENRCACGQVKRDYSDPAYRRGRAFMNAIEISGPFVMATLVAIMTGAAPFWVNMLTTVFLVARIATAVVHIATENQGLRSATWAVGTVCVAVLAVTAMGGAFR
ncbi:MAPEG family protein [Aliishimia ponticola]|uniref:MAPEG family protein n=1 Tax=Aliishimia ponticola TaxID=2499833 RepID=A0A4S4NRY3_9RHOB|nr:MAPEG family protein [Aliishimia ponticola]THH38990.1 MAPEG family protein [Aliishimia ponticola]